MAYPIKGTPYYTEVESRVLSDKPWDDRTDRDLTVAGRHSRRFYSFATRWMVNEVAFHKLWHSSDKQPWRLAKTYLNSRLGRVGMALTAGETETGGQR